MAERAAPDAGSRFAIYGALAANVAIVIAKAIVALASGSSAMLSECVHSLIDTSDGLLLLYGQHRAKRPPDAGHPLGYGRELYFWTLVVAMLMFAMGGGVSIYKGVTRLMHPEPFDGAGWTYVVLAAAFVFEGSSLGLSLKIFNRTRRRKRAFLDAIRGSKDPSVFTVIFEDAAALAGIVIAFIGVFVATTFDMPRADAVASLLIGLLLSGVAIFLGNESKSLLIGEAADPEDVVLLRRVLERDGAISEVFEFHASQLGPTEIIVSARVRFDRALDADAIASAVDRLSGALRRSVPAVRLVFVSPARAPMRSSSQ